MRNIVLHHHFFKCGGTSVDYAFSRLLQQKYAEFEASDGCVTMEQSAEFLSDREGIAYLTSHNFEKSHTDEFFDFRNIRFVHLSFVREPLERFISAYLHEMRTLEGEHTHFNKVDLLCRSKAYFTNIIEKSPQKFDNPQVNSMARSGRYSSPVGPWDFERAKGLYRNFMLCAPLSRYDEAMTALEYFLRPVLGSDDELDLAYPSKNVSKIKISESELAEAVGAKVFGHLAGTNVFDRAFCSFASEELDRRLMLVPDFTRRLQGFKSRRRARAALDPLGLVSVATS